MRPNALDFLAELRLAELPRPVPAALVPLDMLLRHLDYPSRVRAEILGWAQEFGTVVGSPCVEPWHVEALEAVLSGETLEIECQDNCRSCIEDAAHRLSMAGH